MRITVDSGITISGDDMSSHFVHGLLRELTFKNPEYTKRERLDIPIYNTPEFLCFADEICSGIRVPRGAIRTVRKLAKSNGITVSINDNRILPDSVLPEIPLPPLRPYQQHAVNTMISVTQGTIVVPCGGGKTRIGIGVISRLRTPTIILVHTIDLAEQWREELNKNLGTDAGIIGGGELEIRQITVALIQSLTSLDDEDLRCLLSQFGMIVLDEAHHVAARTFRDIIDVSTSKYRFGLTATPDREDGLSMLIPAFCGRIIVRVTHEELAEAGVLKIPRVKEIETDFFYPYESKEDYTKMISALVSDKQRNSLAAKTIAAEAGQGQLCLVLSGRIAHCNELKSLLATLGIEAHLLTGKESKKNRKEVLEKARSGDLRVIIATTVADEGLDLPSLSRVFLTYPSKAKGRTIQRIGRLMRVYQGKDDAVLFDFVDRRISILRYHYFARRRVYREILGADPEHKQSGSENYERILIGREDDKNDRQASLF